MEIMKSDKCDIKCSRCEHLYNKVVAYSDTWGNGRSNLCFDCVKLLWVATEQNKADDVIKQQTIKKEKTQRVSLQLPNISQSPKKYDPVQKIVELRMMCMDLREENYELKRQIKELQDYIKEIK